MNNFAITIDGRPVEVQPGESVLAAARRLGLDIPTLCYLERCGPLNTCQVCLVKINGKLVPSCGTKVSPGIAVESETTEVHEARRTAILVPQTAIEDGGFDKRVHVVGADGKPVRREVVLGQPWSDQVAVTSGLAEGERLLASAPKR